MSTIAVTGPTGQLGRLAVEALLDRGVAPSSIVAVVRSPAKAADLADRGVQVREADYGQPEALVAALRGVDRLLLVSSSDPGQRFDHHANVIKAAAEAGVGFVAYTSILSAGDTKMLLAADHIATEDALRASGLRYALLRNGWYTENYTAQLATILEHGALLGSAQDGRVAPAARRDYAEAAAVVLTTDGHDGQAYELAGDEAITLTELAAIIAEVTGEEVAYRDLPAAEYEQVLAGAGVPAPMPAILADSDVGILRGELVTDSGDLARLIGHPTTPVADTVREAAAALSSAAA